MGMNNFQNCVEKQGINFDFFEYLKDLEGKRKLRLIAYVRRVFVLC